MRAPAVSSRLYVVHLRSVDRVGPSIAFGRWERTALLQKIRASGLAMDYLDYVQSWLGLLGNRQHGEHCCRDVGRRHPRLRSSAGVSGTWSL
jgi:hypothetical protein